MGYYTTYKLEVKIGDEVHRLPDNHTDKYEKIKNVREGCEDLGGDVPSVVSEYFAQFPIMDVYYEANKVEGLKYGLGGEPAKWYDFDDDMKVFSKKFPDYMFILSGKGEDSGDIWRTYYKNGKAQVAKVKIEYEAFDESKLQ